MKKIAADRNYRMFKKIARGTALSGSEGVRMLTAIINEIKNNAEAKSLRVVEDPYLRDDLGLAAEEFMIKVKADTDESRRDNGPDGWGPKERAISRLEEKLAHCKKYMASKDYYMMVSPSHYLFRSGIEIILGRN